MQKKKKKRKSNNFDNMITILCETETFPKHKFAFFLFYDASFRLEIQSTIAFYFHYSITVR